MASVTHPFVSAVSDGADATLVRPSNWNAGHTLTGLVALIASGAATLGGQAGVTVTHNYGSTSYVVSVMPTGATPGGVGELSVVRAANTVAIYNSGQSGGAADYLIATST